MTIHISQDDALRALREVVAEFGEGYVYPTYLGCRYSDVHGNPLCLVAHGLAKLGVDNSLLQEGRSAELEIRTLIEKGIITADPIVEYIYFAAQLEQDGGRTWGAALVAAEESVGQSK